MCLGMVGKMNCLNVVFLLTLYSFWSVDSTNPTALTDQNSIKGEKSKASIYLNSQQLNKPTGSIMLSNTTLQDSTRNDEDILFNTRSINKSKYDKEMYKYKEKQFFLGPDWRTWFMAWEDCNRRGMQFASVDGAEDERLLEKYFKDRGFRTWNATIWLAGSDNAVQHQFVWRLLRPMLYTNWMKGEPNNRGIGNCIQLHTLRDYKWSDEDCFSKTNYLCQYFNETITPV